MHQGLVRRNILPVVLRSGVPKGLSVHHGGNVPSTASIHDRCVCGGGGSSKTLCSNNRTRSLSNGKRDQDDYKAYILVSFA